MRTDEAIKHFGSHAELAKALGIKAPSIYEWGEYPPDVRQLQLERITDMKAEPECQARVLGLPLKRSTDRV